MIITDNQEKYYEMFDTIFKPERRSAFRDVVTYLLYAVKISGKEEEFKKSTSVIQLSGFFNDPNIKRYFNTIIEKDKIEIKSIHSFFLLYDSVDIDVLRKCINDFANDIDIYRGRLRAENEYDVDELINRVLDIRTKQDFLFLYNVNSPLLKQLVDLDINLTVFIKKFDNIIYDNNDYNVKYFYLKAYCVIHNREIKIVMHENDLNEDKFDRIYSEPTNMLERENTPYEDKIFREHLKENGIGIKVVKDSALESTTDNYRLTRSEDIKSNILKAVVIFPSTLGLRYFRAGSNKAIMVYDKKEIHNSIRMVDAQNEYEKNKNSSYFSEKNIKNIIEAINEDKEGLSQSVNCDIISNSTNISLSPFDYLERGKNLNKPVALESIASIKRGNESIRPLRVTPAANIEGKYEYRRISIADLDEEEIDYEALEIVRTDKDLSGSVLDEGCILLNKNGNPIRIVLFKGGKSLGIVADGNLIVIEPDKEKVLPEYLKIFLESEEGRKALENIAQSGLAIRSINISRLIKVMIPLIDMKDQIELIKKYNENLKEIERIKKENIILLSKNFCRK